MQAPRRDHRHRPRHAGRQRRRDDVGALLAGRSGGAPITLFDASGFPTRIAAEVKDFDDDAITSPIASCSSSPTARTRFALAAAEQALRDAGIAPDRRRRATRWGCAVGAGMMGVDFDDLARRAATTARADGELDAATPARPIRAANDPMVFCRSQATAGLSLLTRRYGIRGYATSVHTACASGGQAIGTALKLIRRGAVDRALAGGFDSMISPVGLAGFCLLSARLARQRHAASARAVRSTPRATASCSAKAPASSCSRNGNRRGGAARASTRSSPATAIRCRATASPIRRPTATDRSRRCAQALADAGAAPSRRRLHQRARHVDRR